MSKGTLKKVMGTIAMTLIGISCYSCSENNIPEENGNYTPVRTGNNIQIVSGTIPAPTEAPTTSTVVNDDDSYIVRINNTDVTEVTTPVEKTVATTVTTVNDSAMWKQTTNTNTAQTYNEVGNSPIIWKNGYQYYTVQSGDSWSSIAAYLDVDVVQLAAANNCSVYDVLYIGDDLFIPNEYVDYTQQSNNYTSDSSYTQANTNSYTNQMSGTCLSSVTLYSAPDSASWNNIEVSLGALNGMTLAAGETFNWENQIGWATVSTYYGYQEAPVLVGSDVDYAVGGGVCVTSTALFQAARDAGMAIYERHDHSRGVSYATPGNEASVSYGCLNLIFNNTTGYDVVFYTSCYYGSVTVSCYIA